MKKRNVLSIVLYLSILALLFGWVTGLFNGGSDDLTYSQILQLFRSEQVKSFTVVDHQIHLELHAPYKGENRLVCDLADAEQLRQDLGALLQTQLDSGILETYHFVPEDAVSPYDWILPLLLVGGVLLLIWMLLMSRANANQSMNNFGKARTTLGVPGGKKVTFDDVAGADEEKAELQEVVDFLRDPDKFRRIGARIPHGLLLVGPPGTGKTLLARAVAGEADVQFLSISGSDFVELYVGVGASRVRDLFQQAK